jgi:3-mercaptopyruvate sulfurtransferase SseA
MRILSSITILLVAVFLFGACNSTDRSASNRTTSSASPNTGIKPKSSELHPDGARRINVQEAQALLAKGQAVVIDVRNQAAYEMGHIRGAKLIPVAEVGTRSGELPRDKTIITYCS